MHWCERREGEDHGNTGWCTVGAKHTQRRQHQRAAGPSDQTSAPQRRSPHRRCQACLSCPCSRCLGHCSRLAAASRRRSAAAAACSASLALPAQAPCAASCCQRHVLPLPRHMLTHLLAPPGPRWLSTCWPLARRASYRAQLWHRALCPDHAGPSYRPGSQIDGPRASEGRLCQSGRQSRHLQSHCLGAGVQS